MIAVSCFRSRVPGWRAFEAAGEHATWTPGKTTPFLRLNGIGPPAYQVFEPDDPDP